MAGLTCNYVGVAFATVMATVPVAAATAQDQQLNDAEQDKIAATVLDYALSNKTYFSANARNFDFYLSVRGHDPSSEFLKALMVEPDKYKPQSAAPTSPTDGMLKHAMRVWIGPFTGTDVARGNINAYCGPTCGSRNEVTVTKIGSKWSVTSFQMAMIY